MRELSNKTPGLICDFPKTSEGRLQRSAYPDLEVIDQESHRVYYLDPKLYAIGSRDSSFRTFYFEPKIATNKVREDAVHFIIGFEHEKPVADRHWKFTRWDLVDLSHFQVKLKAEFQGSNRDMYRPEAIVATSARAVEVMAVSAERRSTKTCRTQIGRARLCRAKGETPIFEGGLESTLPEYFELLKVAVSGLRRNC